jgi:hypothetical protein
MPKLIEKPIGMPREDFEKLPPIISRKVFLFATGLNECDFYILVSEGRIRRLPVGRSKTRGRYFKADAAMLINFGGNNGK